jgi:hypothetical protein
VGGAFRSTEDAREALVSDALPARLSDDGRTATWNPALTRAAHVLLQVRGAEGAVETRRSMNSGRARVREGERIEAIFAADAE